MIEEETNPLILSLAKGFMSLLKDIAPTWQKGYLRFITQDDSSEVKASYVHGSGVEIIDAIKHKQFFTQP